MALTLPLPPKQQQRTSIVAVRRREIRFTIFALATLGQFLLGLFASTIPVDPSLANEIRSSIPPNPDPGFIFYHNLITSSLVFVPGVGLGWLTLIIWETGLAFSALGPTATTPVAGWIAWLGASSLPFFWLEIMSYSVAATASTMLLLTLLRDRRNILHEASRFLFELVFFIIILWNAATIELTETVDGIYFEWIFIVVLGLTVILAYSHIFGPHLRGQDWTVMGGFLLWLVLAKFLFVPLVLGYLIYFFWRRPAPELRGADQLALQVNPALPIP